MCLQAPKSHFAQTVNCGLIDHLDNIAKNFCNFVICGDFNCPDIIWASLQRSVSSTPSFEWAMENFLTQNASVSTRPASHGVVDLIFTLFSTNIMDVTVLTLPTMLSLLLVLIFL